MKFVIPKPRNGRPPLDVFFGGFRMKSEDHKRLKRAAKSNGIKTATLIRSMVLQCLDEIEDRERRDKMGRR